MGSQQKILWSEGMFLSPHHFQLWDLYQEQVLEFRARSLMTFGWGLMELDLNREGLANGHFSVLTASGIMPGGTPFSVPDADEPPPVRELAANLDPSTRTLDVFLGVPSLHSTSPNVSGDGRDNPLPARYRRQLVQVADENTGQNELEVAVARKNLELIFGGESRADHDCLQIARLRQGEDGIFELDDGFVPPCLHIGCSSALTDLVRRLREVLHSKSSSLSESRSERTPGVLDVGGSDVGNLFLLHTVNSFIPILDHHSRVIRSHPELLFTALSQLAGALMTLSSNEHPKDLPSYDHTDLAASFFPLEESLHRLLKAVVPTGSVQIPLERETESKFAASIGDDHLLVDAQVFLAAKADLAEDQLIAELPRQAKISSADQITSLLGLALPGVSLVHSPTPPTPLRVKLGLQYFRLETRSDPDSRRHWEEICKSRTLAIRVPAQRLPGLELELWSIKE